MHGLFQYQKVRTFSSTPPGQWHMHIASLLSLLSLPPPSFLAFSLLSPFSLPLPLSPSPLSPLSSTPSHFQPKGYNLTAPDEQELNNMVQRAHELAQYAEEKGVCIMIDAEQTYFQPAIRHLAVNVLMPAYNKSRPIVYNTIQCYLKVGVVLLLCIHTYVPRNLGICAISRLRCAFPES